MLALAIIPLQAVIGGISVLTDLNPWVVALHLLTSMANIAITVVLLWRLSSVPSAGRVAAPRGGAGPAGACRDHRRVVIAAGTVVTGAGPHSGAKHAEQRIADQALERHPVARRPGDGAGRADIGLIACCSRVPRRPGQRARGRWLLGSRAGAGRDRLRPVLRRVPPVLVGIHMFGACLVWIAALLRRADRRPPAGSQQLGDAVDDDADRPRRRPSR